MAEKRPLVLDGGIVEELVAADTIPDSAVAETAVTQHEGAVSITAAQVSDFDTEVSNNTDVAANTAARHDAVTVTDSAELDFTLTGQDITAVLKAGSIDETKLDTSVNTSLALADSATQPGDNLTTLNFAATDKLLARTSAGAGVGEETDFTDVAQTLVAQTTQANMRNTGLGFTNPILDKAAPEAIGGTTPAAVSSTNLSYTGTLTGGTGVITIGTSQFVKDASGNVLLGGTVRATATPRLDVIGAQALCLSNVATDATNKFSHLTSRHYTNSEETVQILYGTCALNSNIIRIGGGSASHNSVTQLSLYTAANTTTVTGTERTRFTNSANIFTLDTQIGGAVTDTPGARFHVFGASAKMRIGRPTSDEYYDIARNPSGGALEFTAAQATFGHFRFFAGATELFRLQNDGEVNIPGNTKIGGSVGDTPSHLLQVAGALRATTIELGHDTDTTLSRVSAGIMAVEGITVATSSNTLTFTNKSGNISQWTNNASYCKIHTGTYTGDGTTSQAITGVGFAVKYVKIWIRSTASSATRDVFETTDTIVDDNASGTAWIIANGGTSVLIDNRIIAVGSDGFTVDDDGADEHPNKSGTVYNFLCLG